MPALAKHSLLKEETPRFVIAGLDPVIQKPAPVTGLELDCRIKPGNDKGRGNSKALK
jgi:hypothetical protein